ncbi:glyoxalase/bleomycin resistance/extradiol dioxygenase family protein [Massilia sp. IC2-477]|uniref:VOC family protein n=1 Tax=unclassified Massilia TaxID=2609279 RepID=UPI001D0F5883|nr:MULTISPECIES: VOC family protein [unclassified Massilia]MCC2955982.1 glyoxalase/bleomycin resistance/extradiol dioxygenase family protein [Massilia sp. IC2-477]MCC2970565.1 glyoxalase/bleomycin resistance/extradiol dioxygenase family protein [Massilia sp. IC2-476]
MNKQIYVNLPVKDLERSKAFFSALGFGFNPQFTNQDAACMVISEDIYVMLLTETFFKGFTPKAISDARKSTEVLLCLSCDSRAAVDDMAAKARAAGGNWPNAPKDHGFMYQHGFEDLDGHMWELAYMEGMPEQALDAADADVAI